MPYRWTRSDGKSKEWSDVPVWEHYQLDIDWGAVVLEEPGVKQDMVETFTAAVWVGLKERDTGMVHSLDEARAIAQGYVDEVGLCVSFTETEFIYTGGSEPGAVIGLINYPRFPENHYIIAAQAIELARRLMSDLRQCRVSVVLPDRTIMLTNLAMGIE